MRLYHSRIIGILLLSIVWVLGMAACSSPPATQAHIDVKITADGHDVSVQLPPGSTVQQALDVAGLSLGTMDRAEPPLYSILTSGSEVHIIRVTEDFEVVQEVIPFEQQTLKNESLPQDQEIYLQKGKNGLQEITYRRVYEDGVEVSGDTIVKKVTLEQPVPEIIMIGIQAPFVPVAVPGKLIYLRDGNAWMIEESTGNRQAVVTTGDLDGRILSLSSDGSWLLFSRKSNEEGQINGLWVKDISSEDSKLIDLTVPNVIHFADWIPGSDSKIVFSTVEPRTTAPGWQANNDLYALSFSKSGWVTKWKDKPVLEPNSGGIYGWWGTSFAWAPDGEQLAYARPDGIGLLNFLDGTLAPVLDMIPYQTRGDWAWVPGLAWGPDGKNLYTVDHVPPAGTVSPEESQVFDLTAISMESGAQLHIVSQAGMFAYPVISPPQPKASGENAYQVAYLQAIFPNQSESSRYRLMVMDRDGSNRQVLFPTDDRSGGLSPQNDWGAWSPDPMPESGNYAIAFIYQGNLWIVDAVSGKAQQITGDGLTTRVIWK
jgi:hypothetical protein